MPLYINIMSTNSGDKQILELLQIRLGLEQKSERIFKELLKGEDNDPLDQLFKNMVNKNRQIDLLKNQLEKYREEVDKLKRRIDPNYKKGEKVDERAKSLPEQHEENMKSIGNNKKIIEEDKEKYRAKVQSFIIFLIKCIKELSRANIDASLGEIQEKAERNRIDHIADGIQKKLQIHSHKILQPDQIMWKQMSQTAYTNQSEQNLAVLINKINKNYSQNPELMFGEINRALGLEQEWKTYIGGLKEEIRLFGEFKQLYASPSKSASEGIFWMDRKNAKAKDNEEFKLKMRENCKIWKLDVNGLMKGMNEKLNNQELERQIKNAFSNSQKQLYEMLENFNQTTKNVIEYFFTKLDNLFQKHNQSPYGLGKNDITFGSFNSGHARILLKNNSFKEYQDMLFNCIEDNFKIIDRCTKFYSVDRTVLRLC